MLLQSLAKLGLGLDKKATTILSDMTPASSGDTGADMPRPILDCGPYANTVYILSYTPAAAAMLWHEVARAEQARLRRMADAARAQHLRGLPQCGPIRLGHDKGNMFGFPGL